MNYYSTVQRFALFSDLKLFADFSSHRELTVHLGNQFLKQECLQACLALGVLQAQSCTGSSPALFFSGLKQ